MRRERKKDIWWEDYVKAQFSEVMYEKEKSNM